MHELPDIGEAVTIRSVAADGAVSLSFRGLASELAANERWECQTARRERNNDYTTKVRTSVTLKNHGALDKQAIQCAEPGRACRIDAF